MTLLLYDSEGNIVYTVDELGDREGGKPKNLEEAAAAHAKSPVAEIVRIVNGEAATVTTDATVWPELLDSRAYNYRVEVDRRRKQPARAPVHKETGERVEREEAEQRAAARAAARAEERRQRRAERQGRR